jgi:hypothetical protein
VAPKIVGLIGLTDTCDTDKLRLDLIRECLEYAESKKSKREEQADIDSLLEDVGDDSQRAFMAPNPGSSANQTSRKQRMIFMNIDRNDPYAVLDAGKVVDIVVMVMSCKNTNVSQLKNDPFEHANAIDEVGYKALGLLRAQGLVSLIGVL